MDIAPLDEFHRHFQDPCPASGKTDSSPDNKRHYRLFIGTDGDAETAAAFSFHFWAHGFGSGVRVRVRVGVTLLGSGAFESRSRIWATMASTFNFTGIRLGVALQGMHLIFVWDVPAE